jgi:hypothetical protein
MLKTAFLTEFLSETNLILTQEDYGNKLYDLLSPIRNLMQEEKDVLTFSISRYCGADTRLAFFAEWHYQTIKLTLDSSKLLEENRKYFKKRVPLRLKGVPNLYDLIDHDIKSLFLPQQITFLHTKSLNMMRDILFKNEHLSKYLSNNYLNRVVSGEITSKKYLYTEDFSLFQFNEAQSHRVSYALIAYPALLGLTYNFNQSGSEINPKGVKWVLIEEILESIANLHETGESKELDLFIYRSRLTEKDEFEWLQKSYQDKLRIIAQTPEVKEIVNNTRKRVYDKAKNDLENLIFPEKYKDMFNDLLDWAYELRSAGKNQEKTQE